MKNILNVLLLTFILLASPLAFADGSITVTSVSLTNEISPNMDESKTFFLINTVLNGGSQTIAGTITPEETKSNLGGKAQSEYPLKITGKSTQDFFYPIDNVAKEQVEQFIVTQVPTTVGSKNWAGRYPSPTSTCPSGTHQIQVDYRSSVYGNYPIGYICVKEAFIGNFAPLRPATSNFQAEITATVNGDSTKATVTNKQTTASFDNGRITAQWTGSLITGNPAPDHTSVQAILPAGSSGWKMTPTSTKTRYLNEETTFRGKLSSWEINHIIANSGECDILPDANAMLACWTEIVKEEANKPNQYAQQMMAGTGKIGQFTYSYVSGTNSGFKVVANDVKFQNPNILFRVRADWIGIIIPEGVPYIHSAVQNPATFAVGEPAQIVIDAENKGTADSFYATLTSCSGFEQTYSSDNVAFSAGQRKNIIVDIVSDENSVDLAKLCTVKVCSYSTGKCDSESVRLSKEKSNQCTPGQVFQLGNSICTCSASGEIDENACEACSLGVSRDAQGKLFCSNVGGSVGGGSIGFDFDIRYIAYGLGSLIVVIGILFKIPAFRGLFE